MDETKEILDEEMYICVDTSGSTYGCTEYYERVHSLIDSATRRYKTVKLISWNDDAEYCKKEDLNSDTPPVGDNEPKGFLNILKSVKNKYNLIVTSDGEIWEHQVKSSKEVLSNSSILTDILSLKVYFIGHVDYMNLKVFDLFQTVKDRRIIINNDEPIKIIDIDVDKLTYDDLVNNNSVIASVLDLIKTEPDKKEELRVQLCRLYNRILAELAKGDSLKKFYAEDDVEGCVEFVKNIDPANKTKFQQVMSKLIHICTEEDVNLYSLSHLITSKTINDTSIPVKFDETVTEVEDQANTEENEDYITCDITLIKSNNPCAEIVVLQNDQDKIISDDESKLISQNPWLILNDEKIINRIVKHVGNYTYDLITKNRMDEAYTHYKSAFTRQEIYGVFVFHRNKSDIDYNLVFKNNSRAISFIFNKKYKLPGNKSVWNILFLYILGKYHPHWKQHSKMIYKEIINILPRLSSFVTLSPLLNPPIIDSLDVCLWYIMKVSHCAFPNSGKNILRSIEGAERLIEIYEYIYPDRDVSSIKYKLKGWNTWKYLIRNRTSKILRLEVISQYQNHEIIDGNIILLSGKSDRQSIDLKPLHTQNLFNYMLTKPSATLFERLPFENFDDGDVVPIEGVDDSVDEVKHIKICLKTCRPLYQCSVSKKVWKECADSFDVKKESFFRAFTRFCEKYKRYPENVEEFLINHSNHYNYGNDENFIVYGNNIKECFKSILEKYSEIMKTYSAKDFVWIYNKNCEIENRLKNESQCTCEAHINNFAWMDWIERVPLYCSEFLFNVILQIFSYLKFVIRKAYR